MDQEFECKEPGCGKRVEYESQPVEFLETVELPTTIDEADVYLTCENGHTYPYKVRAVIDGM